MSQTNSAREDTSTGQFPLAESYGDWTVDFEENMFGHPLEHDVGGPVIYMALPFNAGWHTMGTCYTHLAHQTYAGDIEEYFEENGTNFRAIKVVNLDTGESKRVWETDKKHLLDESHT